MKIIIVCLLHLFTPFGNSELRLSSDHQLFYCLFVRLFCNMFPWRASLGSPEAFPASFECFDSFCLKTQSRFSE